MIEIYQWLLVLCIAGVASVPVLIAGWFVFERDSVRDERQSNTKPKRKMATIRN